MLPRSTVSVGRKLAVWVVTACALLLLSGFPLQGQGFGSIVGTVTDPQGLGVPGAQGDAGLSKRLESAGTHGEIVNGRPKGRYGKQPILAGGSAGL